jgi:hypothetical protein
MFVDDSTVYQAADSNYSSKIDLATMLL